MSDNDSIDLRGTQGAVVLPGGTVTQHYSTPPEASSMSTAQHHEETEYKIDIALLKNQVATNTSDIRDLWSAVRQITGMRTIDSQSLLIAVVVIIGVTVAVIYVGGNWR